MHNYSGIINTIGQLQILKKTLSDINWLLIIHTHTHTHTHTQRERERERERERT